MRRLSVPPAPATPAACVLLLVAAILLPAALGAGGPAPVFAPEQILPVHHTVSDDGIQASHAYGGPGNDLPPWAAHACAAPFLPERCGACSLVPERNDAAWREFFLVSRFNTKYK